MLESLLCALLRELRVVWREDDITSTSSSNPGVTGTNTTQVHINIRLKSVFNEKLTRLKLSYALNSETCSFYLIFLVARLYLLIL